MVTRWLLDRHLVKGKLYLKCICDLHNVDQSQLSSPLKVFLVLVSEHPLHKDDGQVSSGAGDQLHDTAPAGHNHYSVRLPAIEVGRAVIFPGAASFR